MIHFNWDDEYMVFFHIFSEKSEKAAAPLEQTVRDK